MRGEVAPRSLTAAARTLRDKYLAASACLTGTHATRATHASLRQKSSSLPARAGTKATAEKLPPQDDRVTVTGSRTMAGTGGVRST
jgi:hypothetical protein